eukprot:896795-Alexandrium_andersonii.AAC.1
MQARHALRLRWRCVHGDEQLHCPYADMQTCRQLNTPSQTRTDARTVTSTRWRRHAQTHAR